MAMSREEFEAIYRQWLATNPQVQQRQVAGAGDNESYTPGGTFKPATRSGTGA